MIAELAAYWVLVVAAGLALVGLVPFAWRLTERLAASLLVGIVASSLVTLGLSLWWGLGVGAVLAAPALLLGLAAIAQILWRGLPLPEWGRLRESLVSDLRAPGGWFGLAVAAVVGVAFYLIFTRAVEAQGAAVFASYPTVWSDWSVHASYAQSFLLGHNLPPKDSLDSGTGLRYPFMADFQSATLMALGQSVWGALDVPSWLVSWAGAVLVWQLALRVTRRPGAASLGLLLLLFGGGLGFVGLYGDGCQQLARTQAGFRASSCTSLSTSTPSAVLDFVGHLPTELTHLPRSYDGQSSSKPLPDLVWYDPLLVYWLPQRDFDYGMALVALLGLMLWEAQRGRRRALAVGAGICSAALPWFNPFGFLAVVLVGIWWLGRRGWWRGLLLFLVPLLVLGLPRMLYVVTGPHGALQGAAPLGANSYPQLDLGWLAHGAYACTAAQFQAGLHCDSLYVSGATSSTAARYLLGALGSPEGWGQTVGFWLANTGVFLVLAALLFARRWLPERLREEAASLELTRFWSPFWLLFLLGNVVITQPWNWDNTKLFQYWYLGAAVPVAWLICAFGRRGWRLLGAVLVVLSLTLSGLLALDMALIGQSNLSDAPTSTPRYALVGAQEQVVARAIRQRTGPHAVFLTEGQPNEPAAILAGRSLMLAYDGWLWSYGEVLGPRLRAAKTIYAGCPSQVSHCRVGQLLRAYRVSYIEFEPGDYNSIDADLAWFESAHLPVLVRTSEYLILDVRSLWSR